MKLFEGKNPAERNKLIAAIILGSLAFLVVGYNLYGLFFAGRPKTTVSKSNSNNNTSANSNTKPATNNETAQVLEPIPEVDVTEPVVYLPANFFAPIGSRNIFAFYEPPPPTPYSPTPIPPVVVKTQIPTPEITPVPPPVPNIPLGFMSPQSVYAGQKGFRLELNGDKFLPETLIIINGMQMPTNFVSGQKLTTDIPPSMIGAPGTLNIEVRSLDNKWFSNMLQMSIQQPPLPDYEYVGLISRQRANNDTAYLMAKGGKDPIGVRLNDTVGGRFRVISISNREIVLKDKDLGFEYRKQLIRATASGKSSSGGNQPNPNGLPPGIQPYNPQMPGGQCPPGIPCNNVQPYNPTQQNDKKEPDDEDDDGN